MNPTPADLKVGMHRSASGLHLFLFSRPGFATHCLALTGVRGSTLGESDARLITIGEFDAGRLKGTL
jgi:hypothetical protein